jgi:histidinol dehydrogenase
VLATIDLRGRPAAGSASDYAAVLPRADFDVSAAVEVVRPICDDVAARGETALRELSERFDRVVPPSFRVPADVLAAALDRLDPDIRAAFEVAIARRRAVSAAELGEREVAVDVAAGARVTQRMIPVGRVGLYVPGGLAPLASSVIMNVVPAQVAGVPSIAVSSPPQRDFGGLPHPNILALCALLGVDEVYAVGGAQAVAMFAYGVPGLCDRVDLVSQAEHDPMAAAVLVTDSPTLADAVRAELPGQVDATKHAERIRTALAGRQSAVVLVDDVEQGIAVVNAYAAEHLEIQTADAEAVAARITNAGAIFVGSWSPVSLGDYCAGSTHVLPTAGAACHSSGLNVKSFLKAVHVIAYSRQGLADVARHVEVFAEAEDLPAHGAAVSLRFPR